MKIFVDGDSCAKLARKVIIDKAISKKIPVKFIANRNLPLETDNPLIELEIVEQNADEADNHIVNQTEKNDIAITRDILLAERLIKKEVLVINDLGTIISEKNIQRMINERNLSLQMKALGVATGGKFNSYNEKKASDFSKALDSLIN